MKTLIVSFVIWIFVVPAAVALFLIFRFLAAHSSRPLFRFRLARSGLFHFDNGLGTFLA